MPDKRCYFVDIKSNQEEDGRLLVVESNSSTIPFEIKRIFWVRDVIEGGIRGQHANKQTRIILIAISGSCDVIINDGKNETTYHLDNPTKGLFIDKMLWRTMENFSKDCILEAICDNHYIPEDEIYDDFEEYLKELRSIK